MTLRLRNYACGQSCKDITAGNFIWRYNDGSDFSIRENKQKRPVVQYDRNLIKLNKFNSITEASIKTEVSINSIWSCCKGINKTGGKFIWKYEN